MSCLYCTNKLLAHRILNKNVISSAVSVSTLSKLKHINGSIEGIDIFVKQQVKDNTLISKDKSIIDKINDDSKVILLSQICTCKKKTNILIYLHDYNDKYKSFKPLYLYTYNYCGPYTPTKSILNLKQPVNRLDKLCMIHDLYYTIFTEKRYLEIADDILINNIKKLPASIFHKNLTSSLLSMKKKLKI